MNVHAMADYLEAQSRFCAERARDPAGPEHTKYSLLADIYAVAGAALIAGLTPERFQFPPRDERPVPPADVS